MSNEQRGAQWRKLRASVRGRDTVIPLVTALVTITVLLSIYTVQARAPQRIEPARPLPAAPASPAPPFLYVMQTDPGNEDMVQLFAVRDGALVRIASYPLVGEELPRADRDILRQGLALRDSTELQSALEDYQNNLQLTMYNAQLDERH